MFSNQSVSDASCSSTSENWEEELWANVLSPNTNAYNTNSSQSQLSNNQPVQADSVKNDIATVQHYQMQVSAAYQTMEMSPLLSPKWGDSAFEIPENCTNMSTYFSTFNPLSQFQDDTMSQNSVRTSLNMMSERPSGNRTMHTARISLVPNGNGNFKAVVKRKRKRTIFTTEQLEVLEEVFSKKPYVNRDERQLLVEQLQVNDKSVKIWFQNRRLKNKKVDDQNEVVQDGSNCNIFDRIKTVESEIIERTDEFGYVTLDDKIVNDLVNVIDDYFSCNMSPVATTNEMDNSPIYEPISPASISDYSCEETSSWQHHEPNESVQELMDIDSIIAT